MHASRKPVFEDCTQSGGRPPRLDLLETMCALLGTGQEAEEAGERHTAASCLTTVRPAGVLAVITRCVQLLTGNLKLQGLS